MKWFVLVHTVFLSTPTENYIVKPKAMGENEKQLKKLFCSL